jgi:hypothetical protein
VTSMTGDQTPPAGWYPDPNPGADAPAGQQRYWDGSAWTEHTTTAPTGPAYQAAVQQAPRDGLGLAAFVLGVISLILIFFIPVGFLGTGILGIIGLILGFIGRGRAKRGEATNGMVALWGIITSAAVVVPIDRQPCDPLLELECGDHGGGRPVVVGAASPAAENTVSRRWRPPCPAISVWTGVVGPVSAGWKSSCCISLGSVSLEAEFGGFFGHF